VEFVEIAAGGVRTESHGVNLERERKKEVEGEGELGEKEKEKKKKGHRGAV